MNEPFPKHPAVTGEQRSAQKLETLGMLAGGIAHDFNNLLAAILGNADAALRKLPPGTPVARMVENIRSASLRAAGLTDQMLAFAGQGEFRVEPVDVNTLIEEMAGFIKVSVPPAITLKFSLDETLLPVEADRDRLHQVLMNLVINAVNAIGDCAGVITVATRRMPAPGDGDVPGEVRIEVSDTGCGMDEETRTRMCEPFFTTRAEGRGLGMAIVGENVRSLNGRMEAASVLGEGTSIVVVLPGVDRVPVIVDTDPDDGVLPTGLTILVVDDEPDVREAVCTMLESAGASVCSVAGGSEAENVFRRESEGIGVVMVDLTMPGMNGGEVCRRLREIRADVPVVLSSGYSDAEARRRAGGVEVDGFIQKPYRLSTLVRVLSRALER